MTSRTTLLLCIASTLIAPTTRVAEGKQRKPNLLHIHADDHRPDGLHALGNPALHTPHLDSLVRRGMSFTRCYTMGSMVGAVCEPSRAMMLTGRSWLRIPGGNAAKGGAGAPATFLPRVIQAAGYQTFHMGKSGNGFKRGLREFETSIIDDARGNKPSKDRAHSCQRLADRAIAFLGDRHERLESRPFYAYLAPPVPHDPRSAEPRFHDRYNAAEIALSPSFKPLHPFNNGEMTVRDEKLAPWPRTPDDTRRQTANYYACISGLDHHVGRVFAKLRKTGDWDNTIIIFSGDNGLSLGDHGLFGKQNLYEYGGMHVPLVIAGPGVPHGVSDALVYLMDLYPTFASFAEAAIPQGVEGKSLRPLLSGGHGGHRGVLYTAYRKCQRAICDKRWKLIRYPQIGHTQLFDLREDPRELKNLAPDPDQAGRVAAMMSRLQVEMDRYGDDCPLQVESPKPATWSPPGI